MHLRRQSYIDGPHFQREMQKALEELRASSQQTRKPTSGAYLVYSSPLSVCFRDIYVGDAEVLAFGRISWMD